MKRQVMAITAMVGLSLGAASAQAASFDSTGLGIVGSVHNMNAIATTYGAAADPGKRVCAFCHSPHHSLNDNNQDSVAVVANLNGNATGTTYKVYAPLWSRTDLSLGLGSFGSYQSQTFNPTSQNKAYDPLIGPSRLCLTCHDGNTAIDSYYGATGTGLATGDAFNGVLGGGDVASIGVGGGMAGLSNDHPIGMKYTDYLDAMDPNGSAYELMPVATKFSNTAGNNVATKSVSSVLYSDPSDTNVKDFVTCASCHDVHNGKAVGNNAPSGGMRGFLLYGSQVDSSFCLTCHNKNNGVVPTGL